MINFDSSLILERFPDADIRTDQCDTVRVYWKSMFAGIRPLAYGTVQLVIDDHKNSQNDILEDNAILRAEFDSADQAVKALIHAFESNS